MSTTTNTNGVTMRTISLTLTKEALIIDTSGRNTTGTATTFTAHVLRDPIDAGAVELSADEQRVFYPLEQATEQGEKSAEVTATDAKLIGALAKRTGGYVGEKSAALTYEIPPARPAPAPSVPKMPAAPIPVPMIPVIPSGMDTPEVKALAARLNAATPVEVGKASASTPNVVKESNNAQLRGITSKSATWTGSQVESHIRTAENAIKMIDEEEEGYILFQYDISDAVKALLKAREEGTESHAAEEWLIQACIDPCKVLWQFGFRMTLSCWIMPRRFLAHPTIRAMIALWSALSKRVSKVKDRVKVRTIRQHDEELQTIRQMAVEALDEAVREWHGRLIEGIGKADADLAAALKADGLTSKDQERIESKRDNDIRAKLRQAAADLDRAIRCAEQFDATESVSDLISAFRELTRTQTGTFNARMRQLGRRDGLFVEVI
jgi:hypothetical protein